jgi:ribose-phosphate pyrophosphokinase
MTAPLLLPMPGNEVMAQSLGSALGWPVGEIETRQFPDGESYVRLVTDTNARSIALVCTLARPDEKLLPLLFAAATARELGASRVGLIAPYLAYMRQDRRFNPGEAISSRQVAGLVSGAFDWLVTVDPHLHRYGKLGEIYTIPTRAVHAAPLISDWVRNNVSDPLIIGPDSESEQWVADVAAAADAPHTVLEKVRRGDWDVDITLKDMPEVSERTPVLVDDIISSGRTMVTAVRLIRTLGWPPPVCIGIHGVFAEGSDVLLAEAGARVVTSNTVPHATNALDVSGLLAPVVAEMTRGAEHGAGGAAKFNSGFTLGGNVHA